MGWLRESSKLANYGHSQTTSRGIIYRYFEALSSVSQRREVWESQPYRVTGFEWKLILWKWITLVEQRKGKNQKRSITTWIKSCQVQCIRADGQAKLVNLDNWILLCTKF